MHLETSDPILPKDNTPFRFHMHFQLLPDILYKSLFYKQSKFPS